MKRRSHSPKDETHTLRGRVGVVTATHLGGWAMYSDNLDQKVNLSIRVNGKPVGQVRAASPRPDLKARNIHPTGECGYLLRLEKPLVPGDTVAIVEATSERHLGGSPTTYQPSSDIAQRPRRDDEKSGAPDDHKFFFIHIPKTAGTSLRHMFYELFGQDEIFPNMETLQVYAGYPPADVFRALTEEEKKSIRLFMGHYAFSMHRLIGPKVHKLVFLREPVSRAISHLNHLKHFDLRYRDLPMTRIYELERHQMMNFQVRILADGKPGADTADEPASRSAEVAWLAGAKKNLSDCAFIGITEQFSESVALLNNMFGFSSPVHTGANTRMNVTPDKQPLSDALLSQIREDNRLDSQLYKEGRELLTQRMARYQ